MGKKKDKVIYNITISDIQEVADQELDRELSPEEIELVQNRVGDYIPWYDAISLAINEMLAKKQQL